MIERTGAAGAPVMAAAHSAASPTAKQAAGPRSNATSIAPADAMERVSSADAFVGVWKKVSGQGPDSLQVKKVGDTIEVHAKLGPYDSTDTFRGINGGAERSRPWRGNGLAPGGLVVSETITTFAEGELTKTSRRNEKPGFFGLYIETELRDVSSLSIVGGKLVTERTAAMYNRSALWFGEFSQPVKYNTSNIASFYGGDGRSEYVRAG